ncbi:MAG: hypothetical protein AMXMBFR83_22330 [Phycisphaerae bacterium]
MADGRMRRAGEAERYAKRESFYPHSHPLPFLLATVSKRFGTARAKNPSQNPEN